MASTHIKKKKSLNPPARIIQFISVDMLKKYIPIGREAGSLYSLSTFVWPLRKRHVWPTHCPFPKFPKVKISSQRLSNYHVVGKNPTGPTNAFAWEHGLSLHPPLYSLDGSLYRCIQQYKKNISSVQWYQWYPYEFHVAG